MEAIASTLAVKEGIVPPTINYKEPDPDCDLDVCPNEARKVDLDLALSVSLGFGGHNACIAIRQVFVVKYRVRHRRVSAGIPG